MSDFINVEETAREIAKSLAEYDQEVADATKKVVDDVTKETVDELRKTGPKRTGQYRRNWTKRQAYEDKKTKRNTVYNNKEYRLTHLLEKGHDITRNGVVIGHARPHPHIAAVEKKTIEKLQERIEAAVSK